MQRHYRREKRSLSETIPLSRKEATPEFQLLAGLSPKRGIKVVFVIDRLFMHIVDRHRSVQSRHW